MATLATISPTEEDLSAQLKCLRESHPSTGAAKLLLFLRETRPEWTVSEKRMKKILQQEGLMVSNGPTEAAEGGKEVGKNTQRGPATTAGGKKSSKAGRKPRRHPISTMESKVDAKRWTKKVAIRHLDAVKGKGLVATEHILDGEIVWKEDPWVLTADWAVYSGTVTGNVCTHCSCPLSLRNSASIVTCPSCIFPTNQYCNRLCYSRAQASYHPFLCEGQNPACAPLLKLLRRSEWAAPHALARVTGKLMMEWRNAGQADTGTKNSSSSSVGEGEWENDRAFFDAMAGWTLEDKYLSEGKDVSEGDSALWKQVHALYVETFHQPPTAEGRSKLQHIMKRKTLTADIASKLFTYDAFMLNVGRVDVNRESHGGLYQLHSHMNHSCQPSVSVLHIDVPGSHAQVLNLPPYTGTPVPSRITILAKRAITPGEELTASYVSPLLGVTERRRELRQWGIEHCECPKCMEDEKAEKETVKGGDEDRQPALGDLEGELRRSFGFGL